MQFAKTSQEPGQLIVNSFLLYRNSFRFVAIISLLAALVTAGVNQFLVAMDPGSNATTSVPWLLIVAAAISIVVVCCTAIIMMHQMMGVGRGDRLSLMHSIAFVPARILPLVVTMVMVYLLTAIGLAFFILPGLLVMVFTSMVMPLIIFKQVGPFEAFLASFDLVRRGGAWRTFQVIIVPNAVVFILVVLFRLIPGQEQYTGIFEAVVLFALGPWVYASVLTMYNDLMVMHYSLPPKG